MKNIIIYLTLFLLSIIANADPYDTTLSNSSSLGFGHNGLLGYTELTDKESWGLSYTNVRQHEFIFKASFLKEKNESLIYRTILHENGFTPGLIYSTFISEHTFFEMGGGYNFEVDKLQHTSQVGIGYKVNKVGSLIFRMFDEKELESLMRLDMPYDFYSEMVVGQKARFVIGKEF